MKKCKKCRKLKPFSEYYKHKEMGDGYLSFCKDCTKKRVNNYRESNIEKDKEKDRYRIRENFDYIFKHRYSGMKARVECRNERRYKVIGKEICTQDQFLNWCKENIYTFKKLHKEWKKNDFCRKLCPSIDRINNNNGYTLDNIQWITQQQNSKKYIFSN